VSSTTARVYAVDLDRSSSDVERLGAFLTSGERDAPARTQVARAAARMVLGDALGSDPAAVPISRHCEHCGHATHGRPFVTADVPISFNVSHSGPLALIAVLEADVRIGVDIEAVKPRSRLDALAERVLDVDDHASWEQLTDQDARLGAFLRTWTCKEAYLKARGVGIATPLRAVPIRPDGWTVTTFTPREGFVAALAADRPAVAIEQHEFAFGVMPNGGIAG
jgi:4'-phosphopantetheinyl transferase